EQMPQAIADVSEFRGAAPRGHDIFQAIKDLGGVQTKDAQGNPVGDMPEILGQVRRPGLVNRNGMHPDDMRQALQDRGWFGDYVGEGPRPGDDMEDFHTRLREQAAGRPVYHPQDVTPLSLARRAEIERQFSESGIEPSDDLETASAKLAAWRGQQ